MIIRKTFKFENAHIVRNCSTLRCKSSVHGHSYKVEILLEAHALDNGQMVYDFGLTKLWIKDLIDSFDHCVSLWNGDDAEYLNDMKKHSLRWVLLPVSPSAEQFSRVFFVLIDKLLSQTEKINGEDDVQLHSVIVHETQTGYAQCFRADAHNPKMGLLEIEKIIFSDQVKSEWRERDMWDRLLGEERFKNPQML